MRLTWAALLLARTALLDGAILRAARIAAGGASVAGDVAGPRCERVVSLRLKTRVPALAGVSG